MSNQSIIRRWGMGVLMLGGVIVGAVLADPPMSETPKGFGKKGGGPDETHFADKEVFHYLLTNHKAIRRQVKVIEGGVETLTESDTPEVAKKIQEHVPAMYKRIKENRPLRRWDPLFDALFRNAEKIEMTFENTAKGVKVIETSKDPNVAKLIQAHAEVVSQFVASGFEEAHKEHPVPKTNE